MNITRFELAEMLAYAVNGAYAGSTNAERAEQVIHKFANQLAERTHTATGAPGVDAETFAKYAKLVHFDQEEEA